ncbi:helix-turn-helix transcriptional regulator (plasmid) [Orbus sturtevantii]|uniref:helix-turn-helix transcriptional regulator n=1 Tax=Orbus sturtevantii TaxID=3074109 RepID=UPI00370DDBE9
MTKKHSKTILDLEKVMLCNDAAKEAYENAEYEWKLKELLSKARYNANLTSSDVARKLKVAPSNIHRIESNPSKSSMQTIFKYLDACNAKIDFNLSS